MVELHGSIALKKAGARIKAYYRVDNKYRIVDVGGDWDDFAIRNASDECIAKYVIGDDLFSHITGDEVKMWIEADI
jgi:hypothetical protein